MERDALISDDGLYRWWLSRRWARSDGGYALSIGLNPSKADHMIDDPTIRREVDFAHKWGVDALAKVNLFGFRATEPQDMKHALDPIGPHNDAWIKRLAHGAKIIVVAWGGDGGFMDGDKRVLELLGDKPLFCLGVTKDGFPRHPLYVPKVKELEPYEGRILRP